MHKKVLILYGPPGSGKGTQGNLLAAKLHLVHFDSGRLLESIVYDPERQKEKRIKIERKNFETGKLMTPSFVLREVRKKFVKLGKAGVGFVSSGSPRTLFEAKGEIPILERYFRKENMYIFVISVSHRVSVERNSQRLVCRMCGYPVLLSFYPTKHPTHCPLCGGPLYHRSLDKKDVIPIRIKEYNERTRPILDFMKKRGYIIHKVKSGRAPYQVSEKISRIVHKGKKRRK